VLIRTDRLPRSSTIPILVLAAFVSVGAFWALMQLDPLFREMIAGWRTPGFRAAMEWGTGFGQGWVLGAIGLAVALIGRRLGRLELSRAGLVAVPALIASGLLARAVKILIGRPRPGMVDQGLAHWGPSLAAGYNSFPSGHATSAFTLAAVLAAAAPSWRPALYGLAALVAFSRVAVDAHFVSDVVAGGLLGWAVGRLAMRLAARRRPTAVPRESHGT
jgi:membrane-associated phospholipid phosphatase